MTIDANTKSLLHFDGANNSTTFTDETGKTWTAHGNAKISTAQYKFPTGSGLFDGAGDYIDTPDHADFNFGSSDFTVDFWFRFSASFPSYETRFLAGQCNSGLGSNSFNFYTYYDIASYTTPKLYVTSIFGTVEFGTGYNAFPSWNHAALVRSGTTFMFFINGQSSASDVISASALTNSSSKLSIGRAGEYNAEMFPGNIDEFRISNIARWTSTFTPSGHPYGASSFIPKIIFSGE